MLLAFIIMATLTLGLLFSGWLAPTPGKAQQAMDSPPPNNEATNCVSTGTTTTCLSAGSINLTAPTNSPIVCLGSSVTVKAGTLVTTGYLQVVTTYSNCPTTTVTNPTTPSYGVTWTASVGSFSTSGTGLTATFTPTNCGTGTVNFTMNSTNDPSCGGTGTSTNSGSFNVVDIQHVCVFTTPTNLSRTTIGVGEQVALTACGAPGTVTWSTSAGTVSPTSGSTTTLTAPGNAATATVTVNYSGGSCTLGFSVIEPSGVNMVTNGLRHAISRPDIGFHAVVYIAPDSVNFGAIYIKEETNNSIATGVYSFENNTPHDPNPQPFPATDTVVSGLGTSLGIAMDNVWSGDPGIAPPFTPGSYIFNIPWDFRVGTTSAWKKFTTLNQNCSLGTGGALTASKAGANWSCNVTSPTVSYPGQP